MVECSVEGKDHLPQSCQGQSSNSTGTCHPASQLPPLGMHLIRFHRLRIIEYAPRASSRCSLNSNRFSTTTSFLGEPVPVIDHLFSEEPLPNLNLPGAASLHFLVSCQRSPERDQPLPSTASFQEAVDCDKVTLQPSLL